jgi:imidazolonepropionase-like amidohydrolase
VNIHIRFAILLAAMTVMMRPLAAAEWLELTDLTLFDGTGAEVRAVERLVVRDGEIVAIDGDGEALQAGADDTVTRIDLGGAFVMPGLIDTHVHLANWPRPRSELVERLDWALDHGVTGLRDLGSDARVLAELRRAVELGQIPGPRIRFAAIFGGTTLFDHPAMSQSALGFAPGTAPWLRAASGAVELPVLVAQARGAGADALKLYGDLDAGRVGELAAEARRQDMMVWAHATVFPASPQELVAAGVQSLSHAPYLVWAAADEVPADYKFRTRGAWDEVAPDHPRILKLLDAMADKGVVLDATLAMFRDMTKYRPPEGIEWAMQAFEWGVAVTRLAHERGVAVSVGTDAFFPVSSHAPPNTQVELRTLVEDVGLTPGEALVAATRNSAKAAGLDGLVGTVEVGKRADLLVLGADPLDDIAAVGNIRWVIVDGRIHRRPASGARP